MKIAVEGCGHGELDKIYAAMKHLEEREGVVIDLLICCGDFQAVRNLDDLECMSVPKKYLELGTFWKYYSGEAVAPYPTIFIGGNHEASNYLWELYYGGWVCPNIYYLGHSGVINFGDLRVGGLSGIFKSHDYRTGHHERPPYRGHEVKTAYHVRKFDVDKLKAIREPVDVFLSHDWPRGIAHHGDLPALLRKKKFLADEIRDGSLGSPPAEELMRALRPRYWFSAHLHVKFAALVNHPEGDQTRFLALDKCLPRRDFLQVIDLPDKTPEGGFRLDPEWLAILRENHHRHSVDAAASAPRARPRMARSARGSTRCSRRAATAQRPPRFARRRLRTTRARTGENRAKARPPRASNATRRRWSSWTCWVLISNWTPRREVEVEGVEVAAEVAAAEETEGVSEGSEGSDGRARPRRRRRRRRRLRRARPWRDPGARDGTRRA